MTDEVELEDVEFEVGDNVIFECSGVHKNQPRYQFNDDLGSTDIWAEGTVTHVDNEIIQVAFTIEGFAGTGHCTWPNFDNDEYNPLQWYQEGYLQMLNKRTVCECGAEATYGLNTPHVSWCPKYD